LLLNEKGGYELHQYRQIDGMAGGDPDIRAFVFTRHGETWIVYWHVRGSARLVLKNGAVSVKLYQRPGVPLSVEKKDGGLSIPVSGRRYLVFDASEQEAIRLLQDAVVHE